MREPAKTDRYERERCHAPHLKVLAHSVPWCAAIQRHFEPTQLSWVLDVEGLMKEARLDAQAGNPAAGAIIEVPATAVAKFCLEINRVAHNNPQRLMLLAVGDGVPEWGPLLRASGFAAWFGSLLEFPALLRAIKSQNDSLPAPNQSIETRIESSLPWPTAGSDPTA